jgi:putative endonuclease
MKKTIGRYGENLAKEYMQKKGYELVIKNFRYERAEIDLIFKDEKNEVLIFTEVKTRTNKAFGEPEESVDFKKQEQLIKSAQGFLMDRPEYNEYEKRFDIVSIYIKGNKEVITHLQNAF